MPIPAESGTPGRVLQSQVRPFSFGAWVSVDATPADETIGRKRYDIGTATIVLAEKVQLKEPLPAARYWAVKVVLPGVSPVSRDDAPERCDVDPARLTAFASDAAAVFAPLAVNDIKQDVELALPIAPVVTDMNTVPEAGTTTVTDGPTVVRSP